MTAVGAVSPTYDDNGNLEDDGTFTYGYDSRNRLTSVSDTGGTIATGLARFQWTLRISATSARRCQMTKQKLGRN